MLYLQHGYGKSDRLHLAIDNEAADGVIIAAKFETPANLQICIDALRKHDPNFEIMIDPQVFLMELPNPKLGHLPLHSWYQAGSITSLTATRNICRESIKYQYESDTDAIITPTVFVESATHRSSVHALNYLEVGLEEYDKLTGNKPPLIASILIDEGALDLSLPEFNQLLDDLSSRPFDGYYLVVNRHDKAYNQDMAVSRLHALLVMSHVLGSANSFELISGYSDFRGWLARCIGASGFCVGWAQTGRKFHRNNYIDTPGGGRPPRSRYASAPLLTSILMGELEALQVAGLDNDVLSNVPIDDEAYGATGKVVASWPPRTEQLQHWQTLNSLDALVPDNLEDGIALAKECLLNADQLYSRIGESTASITSNSDGIHVASWIRAINAFSRTVGT